MRDASLIVKDAITATLLEDAALSALGGGRVWDDIPPPPGPNDPPELAFTAVKFIDATPWGNDGYRGSEVTIQVDNFATASDAEPDQTRVASQMNSAVMNALWGPSSISVAPDSPADWILHHVWIEQHRLLDDPNSTAVAHGVVTVVVQITPALPNH